MSLKDFAFGKLSREDKLAYLNEVTKGNVSNIDRRRNPVFMTETEYHRNRTQRQRDLRPEIYADVPRLEGTGKTNKWISHVKAYQAKHGCSYKEAMQLGKETYMKGAGNTFRRPRDPQSAEEIRHGENDDVPVVQAHFSDSILNEEETREFNEALSSLLIYARRYSLNTTTDYTMIKNRAGILIKNRFNSKPANIKKHLLKRLLEMFDDEYGSFRPIYIPPIASRADRLESQIIPVVAPQRVEATPVNVTTIPERAEFIQTVGLGKKKRRTKK